MIRDRRIIVLSVLMMVACHFMTFAQNADTLAGGTLNSALIQEKRRMLSHGNKYVYGIDEAARLVSVTGEPDILRMITTLPGVSQGLEGGLGLFVRGGNYGGNRIEYSGVPVYNKTHLLGLVSAFSPDIIDQAKFHSGGIPVSSGNMSSSLTEITLLSGIEYERTGKASVSPYLQGAYFAAPLKQGRSTVRMAGRVSATPELVGIILGQMDNTMITDLGGFLFDATVSADFQNKDGSEINLLYYGYGDHTSFSTEAITSSYNSCQHLGKLEWTKNLGRSSVLRAYAYGSIASSGQKEIRREQDSKNDIYLTDITRDAGLKLIMDKHDEGSNIGYTTGLEVDYQNFTPETIFVLEEDKFLSNPASSGIMVSVFGSLSWHKPSRFDISAGARPTIQVSDVSRFNIDVHFNSNFFLIPDLGVEVAFDRMCQYYHVLEGLATGWSQDVMVASDVKFPEEVTNQFFAGFFAEKSVGRSGVFGPVLLHATLGAYYRAMGGLISYRSAADMFAVSNRSWENAVDRGTGTSRGIELSATISSPLLDASLSYTFSKTDRTYDDINGGETFLFRFDRPHIFQLNADMQTSKKRISEAIRREQHIEIAVSYSSGNLMSHALSTYSGIEPPMWSTITMMASAENPIISGDVHDAAFRRIEMSKTNNFRLPAYFRIDTGYTFRFIRPRTAHDIAVSVFNILNRHNPYQYFYENGHWKQISIMPVMPSVRWSMRF